MNNEQLFKDMAHNLANKFGVVMDESVIFSKEEFDRFVAEFAEEVSDVSFKQGQDNVLE